MRALCSRKYSSQYVQTAPLRVSHSRLVNGVVSKREVRGGEVAASATYKRSASTVDSVAEMLAPKLKDKRVDWRAAGRSAAAAWGKLR